MPDLKAFFEHPTSPRQRQYEAMRAVVVDQLAVEQAAQRFGYSVTTLYSLLRDLKAGTLELFPPSVRGPQERHTPEQVRQLVVRYRHDQLSGAEISARLASRTIRSRCARWSGFWQRPGFQNCADAVGPNDAGPSATNTCPSARKR